MGWRSGLAFPWSQHTPCPAARPSANERPPSTREDEVPATWQRGQTILGLYDVEDVFELYAFEWIECCDAIGAEAAHE